MAKISKEDNNYVYYWVGKNIKNIKDYLSMKKPSRELLSALIDKISIDKELNICINYKFKPLI